MKKTFSQFCFFIIFSFLYSINSNAIIFEKVIPIQLYSIIAIINFFYILLVIFIQKTKCAIIFEPFFVINGYSV